MKRKRDVREKLKFKPLITRKLERENSISEQVAYVMHFVDHVTITESSRMVTFKLRKAKK